VLTDAASTTPFPTNSGAYLSARYLIIAFVSVIMRSPSIRYGKLGKGHLSAGLSLSNHSSDVV